MKTQISKIIFFTSLSCTVFSQYNGFLRTAKMYEMQKNWDAAISIYNDVLNKNPNNYQTIRSLKALYKKSQRYKEGINFLIYQISRNPNDIQLNVELGEFYFLDDNVEEAKKIWKQGLSTFKNNRSYYRLLFSIYSKHSLDEELFQMIGNGRLIFNDSFLSTELGNYYQKRKQYKNAMDEYLLSLLNNPGTSSSVYRKILMMSDVDCRLAQGVLLMIANRFGDESIGAITGRQILLNLDQNRKSAQEGSYRDFFSRMRIAESRFSSTPIFHGECAAYRRRAISNHKLVENSNADDSQMAVSAIRSGFRAIYDPEITFYEMAPPDSRASNIQKVRRAQGLVRHFWRNRDMIIHRKFGNFRKVMALEFALHIVLPIAMVIGFIAGFSHILISINEFGFQYNSITSLSSVNKMIFISDLLVMLLLCTGILGIPLPGSRLSITFFNFMITLFKAQILILSGRSLHQWQQVSAVRDILAEFDKNS